MCTRALGRAIGTRLWEAIHTSPKAKKKCSFTVIRSLGPNLPSTIFILGHAIKAPRILILFGIAVKSKSSYLHIQHIEHLRNCERELPVLDSDQLSDLDYNI
ncbi:hypothetical protein ACN38_g5830 [Penicillium nordicum]|uniref:Uncharacterized protein n=1 Tax=Penicillium nordicum TaxID=229535 RepID=A0A0M8P944_9EURO|nr:hypothetical protein ACN38_g5830 [Penicillium nordicum]